MDDNPNPITALRNRSGITRQELSALVGGLYQDLSWCERGRFPALPPRVVRALDAAGLDGAAIAAAYLTWLDERRRQLVAASRG